MPAPLILTLALDPASHAFFDELRQRYFPPELNFLAAHLTLFHRLPGAARADIEQHLAGLAAHQTPLALSITGLYRLSRGVAYAFESSDLRALRWQLQQRWWPQLSEQDRQPLRPHVTIQNKVPAEVAHALHSELESRFRPLIATGTGLHLWAYRDGPWEPLQTFPFRGLPDNQAGEGITAK